ncbi:MAG: nitrous oxide reductase family maturation protein NosD, partial [Promethearchaeota archaeon]
MKLGEIKTSNYSNLNHNRSFFLQILLIFSFLITINLILFNIQNVNETANLNHLKISKISGKIYINNNWTAAKSAGICTGSGTSSDPFVIEDLIIDGGNSGSCIFIENSDVNFKIENCTLTNAGSVLGDSGIRLYNVDNGVLINNTASNNDYFGILLHWSNNIDVLQNKLNFNNGEGLHVLYSTNNLLSGNSISNNGWNGIRLRFSDKNDIINNLVRAHSIGIYIDEYSDKNIIEDNTLNINSIGIRIVSQSSCNQILSNFYNGNGQDVQNYQNPQADCSEPINLIPIIIGVVIALIVGISIPVVVKIKKRSSKDVLEERKYVKDVPEIKEEFSKLITPITKVKGEEPEVEALVEISLEEEPITPVL